MDKGGKLMANILDRYFTDATIARAENIRIYGVKHPSEFAPDPADEILHWVIASVARRIVQMNTPIGLAVIKMSITKYLLAIVIVYRIRTNVEAFDENGEIFCWFN